MNITPFHSATAHAAGGRWYPSAANHPALKFLLHQDDLTSGALTWKDRIGNVIVNAASGYTKDADGVLPSGLQSITGAYPAIGTKQMIFVVVGKFAAANSTATLGDTATTGPGIAVQGGGAEYAMLNATNYLNSSVLAPAPTYPYSGCIALHADSTAANEARKYACTNDGVTYGTSLKNGAGSLGTILNTNWPALAAAITLPTGTSRTVMVALFGFTTAPTDIAAAVQWMAANPGKIYPGWKGLS